VSLGGNGLIHNASTCHFASQEIRRLTVQSKTMELPLDAPHLYLPDDVPTVASDEIARIEIAMQQYVATSERSISAYKATRVLDVRDSTDW
jgi:hypothetical protein